MVHASSLQVALAGLGLDEQQLRRVVVMLVAQLKQKTAQKQPVTLQVNLMLIALWILIARLLLPVAVSALLIVH